MSIAQRSAGRPSTTRSGRPGPSKPAARHRSAVGGGPAPALLGGCSPGAGRRHDHPRVRHHVGGVPRPVGGAERHHAGTEVGHGQVRGAGGVGGCLAAQERGGQRARGDHGLVRLDQQRPDPAHGRVGEAVDEVVQPRPVGRLERGVGDDGDRAGATRSADRTTRVPGSDSAVTAAIRRSASVPATTSSSREAPARTTSVR